MRCGGLSILEPSKVDLLKFLYKLLSMEGLQPIVHHECPVEAPTQLEDGTSQYDDDVYHGSKSPRTLSAELKLFKLRKKSSFRSLCSNQTD